MGSKEKLEREKYWRKKVGQWKESGSTLRQFAGANQLNYKSLSRWKVKFLGPESLAVAKDTTEYRVQAPDLVPVHLLNSNEEAFNSPRSNTPVFLELLLLNGRALRFDKNCSLEFLSSLIPVAEAYTNV